MHFSVGSGPLFVGNCVAGQREKWRTEGGEEDREGGRGRRGVYVEEEHRGW